MQLLGDWVWGKTGMGKRIYLFGIFLMVTGYTNAETKVEQCETLLTAGVYNEFLENICGFKAGVSNKFKETYSQKSCPDLISSAKVHELVADVAADTKKRYIAFGEDTFCEENLSSYSELKEAFKGSFENLKQNGFKQKK